MKYLLTILFIIASIKIHAQLNWDGQLSSVSSYSPDNTYSTFLGIRYLPELNYNYKLDSAESLTALASFDINTSVFVAPFDSADIDYNINPYRFWIRYSNQRFQLRLGLQKIDFGVATLLRPLQWFNQIDPRDPLALTNGVHGVMGRYYFKNNANIWLWGLYGNDKRRGFDFLETNKKIPEMGGRLQLPTNSGELGFTYHHRVADANFITGTDSLDKVPENRMAFDIKLDKLIGISLEATFIQKNISNELLAPYRYQQFLNLGIDYTLNIGNGMNAQLEHLIINNGAEVFNYDNLNHISALSLNYSLSFFDGLSLLAYQSWAMNTTTLFINYSHQFKKILAYTMLYYNPPNMVGIQQNELVNNFAGPGIRILLVFNH